MFQVPWHGPCSQGWSCSQGTRQSPFDVSTDHLNHGFDAKKDRLLPLVHFRGKEAASSALSGTTFGITGAERFPFAMQNRNCIHRDGRQLFPTKPAVQSLSRSMMELR